MLRVCLHCSFTGVYEEYKALQKNQGFDLTEYTGMEAIRYTYRVLNYLRTEQSGHGHNLSSETK